MKKTYHLTLLIAIVFCGINSVTYAIEKEIRVKGTRQANLKTYNGCWDVNHFIFCKGDSTIDQHPSFGYIDYNQFPKLYVHIDSLPSYELKDFAKYKFSQLNGYLPQSMYFVLVTGTKMYSYSSYPGATQLPPTTTRLDSIATPSGYAACKMVGDSLLAVVNLMSDSIHYEYTFYTLPSFGIVTQFPLILKPIKLKLESNLLLVKGDSTNINRFVTINLTNYNIDFEFNLPDASFNTKEIEGSSQDYLIMASPGDTVTYLTHVDKNSFAVTIDTISKNLGIRLSENAEWFSQIFYQTTIDTGINKISSKLLALNTNQIFSIDTFDTGVIMKAMHHVTDLGFGQNIYRLIFAPDDSIYNSVMLADYFYAVTDTIYTPKNPEWFAEDFRCFIGISELNKHLSIHVYPNPASDEIVITINGMQKGVEYKFEITNEAGSVLFAQTMKAKEEYTIPINEMPSGILFLRVTGNGTYITKKIIKL